VLSATLGLFSPSSVSQLYVTSFGGSAKPSQILVMRKPIILTLALALAASAQKIATERSDRNRVIRLQTVPNHLSVIELAEPVTEVAAGSSSYKIEWRGNKVFVQPLEPEAATNLFIWTASGRLNYELVAVHSVADAQFAIDEQPAPKATSAADPPPKPTSDPAAVEQAKLAADLLFASRPVRLVGQLKRNRVQVVLKDLYRTNNRIYVRYAIQNDGPAPYEPGTPAVFTFRSPHSSRSLYSLSASQITSDGLRVSGDGQMGVNAVQAQSPTSIVPPGGNALGLIAFELPRAAQESGPTVLRFAFPSDAQGEVSAYLVL
jgi:hypothetical protein